MSTHKTLRHLNVRALPWRQVKLRGFRVELGEVEHALSEIAGVQLAVALVMQDPTGSHSLVAYVTPASLDAAEMTSELKGRLPAHMVPSVIVPLERMPLLPNEKVDRKALPAPEWGAGAVQEYIAPASDLEAQLQAIWQELLGQERVSTHADFFSIGGTSLQVSCHECCQVAGSATTQCPAAPQSKATYRHNVCMQTLTENGVRAGSQGDDQGAPGNRQQRAHRAAVCHAIHCRPGGGHGTPGAGRWKRRRTGRHPARELLRGGARSGRALQRQPGADAGPAPARPGVRHVQHDGADHARQPCKRCGAAGGCLRSSCAAEASLGYR